MEWIVWVFQMFNPKFVKCHWCHWYFILPMPWIKVDKKISSPNQKGRPPKKLLPFQSEKMVACYWQMRLTPLVLWCFIGTWISPSCLWYVGDYTTSFTGTIINHHKDPYQPTNSCQLRRFPNEQMVASWLSLQVLQRSGLTSADLAQIWSLSDVARGCNKPRSGRAVQGKCLWWLRGSNSRPLEDSGIPTFGLSLWYMHT